jgi:hypothetical protein
MKITIEFDQASDWDTVEDMRRAVSMNECYSALNDFAEWLRAEWKYVEQPNEKVDQFIDKAREKLYSFFEEKGALEWLD